MRPEKTETQAGGAALGFGEHTTTGSQDCASIDAERKAFATIAAQLALIGFSLNELSDGSYLASRWNCTKHLPSLYALQSFARLVGAA